MTIRRWIALPLAGLLALAVAFVAAPAAHADEPVYQLLYNYGTGKCLEIDRYGNWNADGAPTIQRTCDNAAPQQRWALRNWAGNNYTYMLVNEASQKCLDVRDGSRANGTVVQQWWCRGSNSMKWGTYSPGGFPDLPVGPMHLIQGKCLEIKGGWLFDGAPGQIYDCGGSQNTTQIWYLI